MKAPSFTSGPTTSSVAENSVTITAAANYTVSDPDAGATLTYTLSGADANRFTISAAGVVTFQAAPNYESPTDADANNVYDVIVQVSDGSLSATQALAVSVTNVNEAPSFTSGPATASVSENAVSTTAVAAYATSDPDAGTTPTYTLSGLDAARFSISAAGIITFQASPNFESPSDSGTNNVYDVIVQVSDGSLSATQALAVSVTNVNEAPSFASGPTTASVAENSVTTMAVATYTTSDPRCGLRPSPTPLAAPMQRCFSISAAGVVTFQASPNFESPADVGANNVYDVIVQVSDGSLSAAQSLAVSVTNVNEAPRFASGPATASVSENTVSTTAVATYSDRCRPRGRTLTYTLSGADAALFSIDTTGVVTFLATPNFESPSDSGANNVYDVIVQASDGSLSATQALAVSVTNVNESPSFTSGPATAGVTENTLLTTALATYTASDPDSGASLTYTLSGADAASFSISATGVVTFQASLNFESPSDSGA